MDIMDKSFLLNRVYVSDYSFALSPSYKIEDDIPERLHATLMHRFEKIDADHAKVEIRVVLGGQKADPYYFALVVGGIIQEKDFGVDPKNKEALWETALAILFPYARSMTSTLTSLAGVRAYVLPVINVRKFFENGTKKSGK